MAPVCFDYYFGGQIKIVLHLLLYNLNCNNS